MGDQRWNLPVLVQVMPHHIRHGLGVRSTSRPNTGFAHIGRRYTWFVTTVAMMTRAKYCQFSRNLLRTGNNRYYRGQVLICRTRGWLRRSLYFIRNVHQWLLFNTKMYAHTHTQNDTSGSLMRAYGHVSINCLLMFSSRRRWSHRHFQGQFHKPQP